MTTVALELLPPDVRALVMDDVGVLLGHRDIKTTKRVYDHTTIYDVRKRMEELP